MPNKEVKIGDDWYLGENNDGDLIFYNTKTNEVVKAIDVITGAENKKGNSINNVSSINTLRHASQYANGGKGSFADPYIGGVQEAIEDGNINTPRGVILDGIFQIQSPIQWEKGVMYVGGNNDFYTVPPLIGSNSLLSGIVAKDNLNDDLIKVDVTNLSNYGINAKNIGFMGLKNIYIGGNEQNQTQSSNLLYFDAGSQHISRLKIYNCTIRNIKTALYDGYSPDFSFFSNLAYEYSDNGIFNSPSISQITNSIFKGIKSVELNYGSNLTNSIIELCDGMQALRIPNQAIASNILLQKNKGSYSINITEPEANVTLHGITFDEPNLHQPTIRINSNVPVGAVKIDNVKWVQANNGKIDIANEGNLINDRIVPPESFNLGGTNNTISPTNIENNVVVLKVDPGGTACNLQGVNGELRREGQIIRIVAISNNTLTLEHNAAVPNPLYNSSGTNHDLGWPGIFAEYIWSKQAGKWLMRSKA